MYAQQWIFSAQCITAESWVPESLTYLQISWEKYKLNEAVTGRFCLFDRLCCLYWVLIVIFSLKIVHNNMSQKEREIVTMLWISKTLSYHCCIECLGLDWLFDIDLKLFDPLNITEKQQSQRYSSLNSLQARTCKMSTISLISQIREGLSCLHYSQEG